MDRSIEDPPCCSRHFIAILKRVFTFYHRRAVLTSKRALSTPTPPYRASGDSCHFRPIPCPLAKFGAMKESRKTRRARVMGRLFFSAGEIEGEGRILDLSATGCKAESAINVAVGLEPQLSLALTDHPWPVQVDQAVVRWVQGDTFGVQFLGMALSSSSNPSADHKYQMVTEHSPSGAG